MTYCQLCKKPSELKISHIYPRFMVKNLRTPESNYKFDYLSSIPIKPPPQDGPKEKLLCGICERQLGKYETYYSQFFIRRINLNLKRKNKSFVSIIGYDYQKIKLFLLSILWRLSITSCKGFNIKIDEQQKEILRTIILREDPGEPHEFPFYTIMVRVDGGENDSKIFLNPIELLPPHEDSVLVYICGILYWFSKKLNNENFNQPSLLLTPSEWLAKLEDIMKIPVLNTTMRNVLK